MPKQYYNFKQKMMLVAFLCMGAGIVLLLSFFNWKAAWINEFNNYLFLTFGQTVFLLPFMLISLGILFFEMKEDYLSYKLTVTKTVTGLFLILQSCSSIMNAGLFGQNRNEMFVTVFGDVPSYFVMVAGYFIALAVGANLILLEYINKGIANLPSLIIRSQKAKKSDVTPINAITEEVVESGERTTYDGFKLPNFDLFKATTGKVAKPNFNLNISKIKEVYKNIGGLGELDFTIDSQPTYGATVTQYYISIANYVGVDKITSNNIKHNLEFALNTKNIRFNTKSKPGYIAIEVPNKEKQVLRLAHMLDLDEPKTEIPLVLGKNMNGEKVKIDLKKLPHLLVAGSSGSGKTVAIHSMISYWLTKFSPYELNLLLIDMMQTELPRYEGVPHLLTEKVPTTGTEAMQAIHWLLAECKRRQDLLQNANAKDITTYNLNNLKGKNEKLPIIVCVIDEFGELMTQAKGVEDKLVSISRIGRKLGVHLVLATQTPSSDVVTKGIKDNLLGRLAFAVPDYRASMIIIDKVGAESLEGNGHGIFKAPGVDHTIQGPLIEDNEIEKLVKFLSKQKEFSQANKEILNPANVQEVAANMQQEEQERIALVLGYVKETVIRTRKIDVNFIVKEVQARIATTRPEIEQVIYPLLDKDLFFINPSGKRRVLNQAFLGNMG
jgi:DNA segregation ATPase FtsK/SpoIIIE-like protein